MRTKSINLAALKAATDDAASGGGSLVERRAKLVETAQAALTEITELDAEGEFTSEEKSAMEAAGKSLDQLDEWLAKATKSAANMARLGQGAAIGGSGYSEHSAANGAETGGRLNLRAKSATSAIALKMADANPLRTKAVASSGDALVGTPLDSQIVGQGRVGTTALDILPTIKRPPEYKFLRQTTRTNNAAVVAVGAVKPTSVYSLTPIAGELRVVAHISEAIHSYWLTDNAALDTFISDELQYGLALAVENAVINGTGAGDTITGVLATSGIQTAAFQADATTSVRAAITGIESAGYAPKSLIVHPTDWQKIELARRSDGQFDQGSNLPVERGAERLWGLQVATSVAAPVGTGILFDPVALAVAVDAGIRVNWSENQADDWSKNQLRCRVEGRFGLDVYRPLGIAKVALAAA